MLHGTGRSLHTVQKLHVVCNTPIVQRLQYELQRLVFIAIVSPAGLLTVSILDMSDVGGKESLGAK